MKTINVFLAIAGLYSIFPASSYGDASISSSLLFRRSMPQSIAYRVADSTDSRQSMVTLRFTEPPSAAKLNELEYHGVRFSRYNGNILHTHTIYPASVELDSLESIAAIPGLVAIEDSAHQHAASTLDVSNPLVQASQIWSHSHNGLPIDGDGVTIVNVDTGIDIYHPAFFKADAGEYDWIDVNGNNTFDGGIDAVDLNSSGGVDPHEILDFYDASFSDSYGIMDDAVTDGVYDTDVDWLYNDANSNGSREYGPSYGFTESSPSYGELLFICSDSNRNNRLDPGEHLTGLGTSKIAAVYAANGVFIRGENLLSAPSENYNHGTPAAGILIGQWPGRKFTGMAPGAELVSINRLDLPSNDNSIEEGIIWAAKSMGAKIVQHEFGSWVDEFLDGTSNYEIMIDEQVADGIHHFTASGNLAGPTRLKHASFTIQKNTRKTLGFTVPVTPYDYKIQVVSMSILWQSDFDIIRPQITLSLGDGTSRTITAGTSFQIGNYFCQSALASHQLSDTRRFDIVLYTTDANTFFSGNFSLEFGYTSYFQPDSLIIDAYISDDKTGWVGGAHFSNFVTDDGTVTAPGTAISGVTVGAYSPREYRSRTVTGDISDFSGWGRTVDGRIAVDITAPGYTVFSPSSHSYVGGNPGGYVDFGGTSAALPFVTGCAALILQAAPDISPSELANVLYTGALVDDFVGTETPNDTWGYGKLHIYDSLIMSGIINPTIIADNFPAPFTLSAPYPNPFNTSTQVDIDFPAASDTSIECQIYNLLGQTVRHISLSTKNGNHTSIHWDGCDDAGNTVSTGIYLLSVSSGRYAQVSRVVFLK